VLATGYAVLAMTADRLLAQARKQRGQDAAWLLEGREALSEEVLEACRRLAAGDTDCEVAVGCAGCILLGDDADAGVVARYLDEVVDVVARDPLDDPAATYFTAIAANQVGGDTWKRILRAWTDGILPAQHEGPRCCLGGSWPATSSSVGGCLEATALLTMACEIYYRYDRVVGYSR